VTEMESLSQQRRGGGPRKEMERRTDSPLTVCRFRICELYLSSMFF